MIATRYFAFFTLLLASLILATGVASAATIFSDDFNDGSIVDWAITNTPTTLPGTEWTATSQYVEAKPGADSNQGESRLQTVNLPTTGYTNIVVKFDRQLVGFVANDNFNVSWSLNGDDWFLIGQQISQPDPQLQPQSFNLPSNANNNANFKLRFTCSTNAQLDACRVDTVVVEGTAIPSNIQIIKISEPITISQNATFRVKNNGASILNGVLLSLVESPALSALSQSNINSIAANGGESSLITISPVNFAGLKLGKHTTTVKAVASGNEATAAFTIEKTFCKAGQVGNLSITNVDIKSNGEDDLIWLPLDEVEIEVDVENTGDDEDVDDVIVKLGLINPAGGDDIDSLDFTSDGDEEVDLGNIKDGKDDTAIFTFRVPADFDIDNYRLFVKAYSDGDEDIHCADREDGDLNNDFYQDIDVDKEDKDERSIVVDDIVFASDGVCGEAVSGSFELFNIGSDNYEDVRVEMFNTMLGLREEFEIGDLDEDDSENLDFTFDVPQNAKNGDYRIEFRTFYDVNEESEDTFFSTIPLRIIGCSGSPSVTGAVITATQDSDAVPGESLVVSALIRNTASETKTFVIDASGYSSWAELDSVSNRIITLDAGDSETVTFEFTINDDASGTESFMIETNSAGDLETQQVEVEIEESQGSKFSLPGSSIVWVIAVINIVLIVLIIFVAIRLSRK